MSLNAGRDITHQALSSLSLFLTPSPSSHPHVVHLSSHWRTLQPAPQFPARTGLSANYVPHPINCLGPDLSPSAPARSPAPLSPGGLGSLHPYLGRENRAFEVLWGRMGGGSPLPAALGREGTQAAPLAWSDSVRVAVALISLSLSPFRPSFSLCVSLRVSGCLPSSLSPSLSLQVSGSVSPCLSLQRPGGRNRSVNRRMARGAPGADTRF